MKRGILYSIFFCMAYISNAQNTPYQVFGHTTDIVYTKIEPKAISQDNYIYRFGFNGKENDKEWGSGGLTQDYGLRLYNPALGKFLSVDPLAPEYPWYTPYQFAGNIPIAAVDLDGAEPKIAIIKKARYLKAKNAENIIHNTLAVPYNAGINLLNIVPNMWNFGVDLIQGKYNSTDYRADILIGRAEEKLKNAIDEGVSLQGLKEQALNPETYEKTITIIAGNKLAQRGSSQLNPKMKRIAVALQVTRFSRRSRIKGLNVGELQRLNVASQVKLGKMKAMDAAKPLSQGGAKVNSLGDITTGKFIRISRISNNIFEIVVTKKVEGVIKKIYKTRLSAEKTGIKDIKLLSHKPLPYRSHFLGATKD